MKSNDLGRRQGSGPGGAILAEASAVGTRASLFRAGPGVPGPAEAG